MLILTVQVAEGSPVEDLPREACALAQRLECAIRLNFHGVTLKLIRPGDTMETVRERIISALTAMTECPQPSPPTSEKISTAQEIKLAEREKEVS